MSSHTHLQDIKFQKRTDMIERISEERLRLIDYAADHGTTIVEAHDMLIECLEEICRLQSENAELTKFKQEIETPVSTENFQSTSRFVLQNHIDRLIKKNADLTAKLDKAMEALKELREFVRYATLEIQSHLSRTDEQKNALFQRAYKLYDKYDVEGWHEKQSLSTSEPMKETEKEYPG